MFILILGFSCRLFSTSRQLELFFVFSAVN